MTQLPNSIERCAPILGFDPYAFIMDKPSNILPGGAAAPDIKNADSFKKNQENNKALQNNKKGGRLLKAAQYAAAGFVLATVALGAIKCTNGVRKLFKKPPIGLPEPLLKATDAIKKNLIYPVENFFIDIFNKIRRP